MPEETTINELMEFLQENMVTKNELDEKLDDLKTELRTEIQQLSGEVEEFRNETNVNFREIRAELDDIKQNLKRLEKKNQEDDDVFVFELEKLKKRVWALEEAVKVKEMKTA